MCAWGCRKVGTQGRFSPSRDDLNGAEMGIN